MHSNSSRHRIIRPKGLSSIGVSRAPGLERLVDDQIRILQQEQARAARQLQGQAKAIEEELRRAGSLGQKLGASAGIKLADIQAEARRKVVSRQKFLSALKRPTPRRLKPQHNPTRYPPFDYWWYSYNWWGVAPTYTFSPDSNNGDLYINASCLEPAGGVVGSAGVAIWYFATSSGSLFVSAQSMIYGAAESMAWAIPWPMGYVSNHSSLRVGAWSGGSFNAYSQDYYAQGGAGVYDFHTSFNGNAFTVSHFIPVTANNWYLLWAIHDTSQVATGIASAAINVDMYIGDFVYYLID